jgi:hypothetical protein
MVPDHWSTTKKLPLPKLFGKAEREFGLSTVSSGGNTRRVMSLLANGMGVPFFSALCINCSGDMLASRDCEDDVDAKPLTFSWFVIATFAVAPPLLVGTLERVKFGATGCVDWVAHPTTVARIQQVSIGTRAYFLMVSLLRAEHAEVTSIVKANRDPLVSYPLYTIHIAKLSLCTEVHSVSTDGRLFGTSVDGVVPYASPSPRLTTTTWCTTECRACATCVLSLRTAIRIPNLSLNKRNFDG